MQLGLSRGEALSLTVDSRKPRKYYPPVRNDRNAEDDVARLCCAAGTRAQRVSEDDHGWDLLVEFPSRVETAFPDTGR